MKMKKMLMILFPNSDLLRADSCIMLRLETISHMGSSLMTIPQAESTLSYFPNTKSLWLSEFSSLKNKLKKLRSKNGKNCLFRRKNLPMKKKNAEMRKKLGNKWRMKVMIMP